MQVNFRKLPGGCVYLCVLTEWIKIIVLAALSLLPLLTEESVAPGSDRQTHSRLLIYEFVQYNIRNMSFLVVGL